MLQSVPLTIVSGQLNGNRQTCELTRDKGRLETDSPTRHIRRLCRLSVVTTKMEQVEVTLAPVHGLNGVPLCNTVNNEPCTTMCHTVPVRAINPIGVNQVHEHTIDYADRMGLCEVSGDSHLVTSTTVQDATASRRHHARTIGAFVSPWPNCTVLLDSTQAMAAMASTVTHPCEVVDEDRDAVRTPAASCTIDRLLSILAN